MNIINRPTFFILAANEREDELIFDLNLGKFSYKEVIGAYKGITERSFVIIDELVSIENVVRTFARYYKQHSYLKVDADTRHAYLIYPNSQSIGGAPQSVEHIGTWVEVPKSIALAKQGYTFDPSTGLYYTTE